MGSDPALLSLTEAVEAIRSGAVTAVELATSFLSRTRESESSVRAWAWLSEERLLAEAHKADLRSRDDGWEGALAGVPIAVKDIIDTAGIPTEMGSPIFRDNIPSESATCVRLLEKAGGIVQGKTVTTEFANRRPGPTTNPWDPRCTPGGSSSGSAAAVAAGFTSAAIGTQTLGSTIRPAIYCGVVGFKPSFGLISRQGIRPLSPTLDQVGLLTRTVEDAALFASCLVGFDPADPGSRQVADRSPIASIVQRLEQAPRLAAVRTPYWDRAELVQQEHFNATCSKLREQGARVHDVQLPPQFDGANEVGSLIQAVEAASVYRELRRSFRDLISPEFNALCDKGDEISKEAYRDALGARLSLTSAIARIFEEFDAILTLPASGEAPATLGSTGEPTFCSTWSICGLPVIAFPTALGLRALPIGIQLVGANGGDQRLLSVAGWCKERLPKITPPALRAVTD